MVWVLKLHEVWGRWISPAAPPLFPLSHSQLEQNLAVCKYVTNCLPNDNKIDEVTTAPCNYFILCFQGERPTFDQLFYFERIKLKFGGGVNTETLISYFMSVLPHKMNFIKIKEFYLIFY